MSTSSEATPPPRRRMAVKSSKSRQEATDSLDQALLRFNSVKTTTRPQESGSKPKADLGKVLGNMLAQEEQSSGLAAKRPTLAVKKAFKSTGLVVIPEARRGGVGPKAAKDSATEQVKTLQRIKTMQPPRLLWQEQDDLQEERLKAQRHELGVVGTLGQAVAPTAALHHRIRAVGVRSIRTRRSLDDESPRVKKKTCLAPQPESDSDVEMGYQRPLPVASKAPQRAARKVEAQSSESSSSSSGSESDSDDNSSIVSQPGSSDLDEDEDAPEYIWISDSSPPPITVPLPPTTEIERDVLEVLEEFAGPTIRMQQTGRLPFKKSCLRTGFLNRCRELGMDVSHKGKGRACVVTYQYANHLAGTKTESTVEGFRCPICTLHAQFPARNILLRHVRWDHPEFLVAWRETSDTEWAAVVTVNQKYLYSLEKANVKQEVKVEFVEPLLTLDQTRLPTAESTPGPATRHVNPRYRDIYRPTAETPRSETLVSLTPSSPPRSDSEETILRFPTSIHRPHPIRPRILSPAGSPPPGSSATASRATSTTTTATGSSVTLRTSVSSSDDRGISQLFATPAAPDLLLTRTPRDYPTPPPENDPLGPSAVPPYLPAEPLYPGGTTIHYSCRPNGPSLFDLLGTLPMHEYGVLKWAILDKEEEIYASDDVSDEKKVMLALWARWIFLHRPAFLKDYKKNIIGFIDHYWPMIHRAAGWDALRYWLVLMAASKFLTFKDVAELLKHYEAHTGMEHWAPRASP